MQTRVIHRRLTLKNRTRARGGRRAADPRRACTLKRRNCIELATCGMKSCNRLESLSNDPIGFAAGDANLYRYVGNGPTNATDPSGLVENGISQPGEHWRIFNIFTSNPDKAQYVVRKVRPATAGNAVSHGIQPSGPGVELHPVEHCLNEHLGKPSPYSPASTKPNGAPNIKGTPVWIDIGKLNDGQVLSHSDIVKSSEEFLSRNEHLRERFEIWRKFQAKEGEVLIKGQVPADAVYSQRAIRLHRFLNGTGKVLFIGALAMDTASFFLAEDKAGEAARIAGGWTGAWAGGTIGAAGGAASAGIAGQLGPQIAIPEELITVPVCGFFGGLGGSIMGYWAGSAAGRNYYDFIQSELENYR